MSMSTWLDEVSFPPCSIEVRLKMARDKAAYKRFQWDVKNFESKKSVIFLEISEIETIYFCVEGLPLKLKTALMWII